MDPERRARLEATTRYEPSEVEGRILERWLEGGYFHPPAEGTPAENFSIAIPPPNVTGALHMGHALNGTIQDALVRLNRMRGRNTLWALGTDHASIAVHAVLEKELRAEGTSRHELGREAFLERAWAWKEKYGSQIVEQLKRLGASCDYDRERFTLDEGYVRAVYRVFVRLHEKGYIYRDTYMVNWDVGSRSVISDLEVENREVEDTLYAIDYPVEGEERVLTVATVRPETMLADTAVAVNPADERYRDLIGRHCVLPLVGRRLPVIADEYVDPEFATGALKVTPGHDPNDFEIGRAHGLDEVTVIGEDGRMTADAGERFVGRTTDEAKEAVLAELREQGLIRGEEPYVHSVPHSHRSGERIEPLISLQWFCRMEELAKPATEVVDRGQVRFIPERWKRVYLDWLDRLRPWCISRQLWWGHRLPVWYCEACEETYVAEAAPERCGACGGGLRQDEDVLDTWFSSALWPFGVLGWPDETPELRAFYPTDVLVTARDIIFLWVARMVMMGLEFEGESPFEDVYITSVIQAPDGRRMSKSLGTGIDPLDEIEAHGADGVRFGLLAMSSAQDVRYSADRIQQGEDLANKMWNASRLILLNASAAAGERQVDGEGRLMARDRSMEGLLWPPRAPCGWRIAGSSPDSRWRSRPCRATWTPTISPTRRSSCTASFGRSSAIGTWRSSSPASTRARPRRRRRSFGSSSRRSPWPTRWPRSSPRRSTGICARRPAKRARRCSSFIRFRRSTARSSTTAPSERSRRRSRSREACGAGATWSGSHRRPCSGPASPTRTASRPTSWSHGWRGSPSTAPRARRWRRSGGSRSSPRRRLTRPRSAAGSPRDARRFAGKWSALSASSKTRDS